LLAAYLHKNDAIKIFVILFESFPIMLETRVMSNIPTTKLFMKQILYFQEWD
jgi:hypothetical protein